MVRLEALNVEESNVIRVSLNFTVAEMKDAAERGIMAARSVAAGDEDLRGHGDTGDAETETRKGPGTTEETEETEWCHLWDPKAPQSAILALLISLRLHVPASPRPRVSVSPCPTNRQLESWQHFRSEAALAYFEFEVFDRKDHCERTYRSRVFRN